MARNAGKIYGALSNQEMLLVWIHIHVFSESSAGQVSLMTNLRFHYTQKLLVILHYSKRFKWMRSNQNTGKKYKII